MMVTDENQMNKFYCVRRKIEGDKQNILDERAKRRPL